MRRAGQAECITRRTMLGGAILLPAAGCAFAASDFNASISAIEKRTGGRFGFAALDTQTSQRLAWRPDERFAMCSTFKFMAVAGVLHRGAGPDNLSRVLNYGPADLLPNAPVSTAHVKEGGLPLRVLCAAAIMYSDNTAANLILKDLGGPAAVTEFARALGDPVTRLDRMEPALNTAIPGDPRDTTSPGAMLNDLHSILVGNALSDSGREAITEWMVDCKTAAGRIRAGLPAGWRIGSKTGTGANHTFNELAITWPPGRKPILIASYLTHAKVLDADCNRAHADAARLVATIFG